MIISAETVSSLVSAVQVEMEAADQASHDDLQASLSNWLTVLHPNHYLIIGIKMKLLASFHLIITNHHPTRDSIIHTLQLAEVIDKVFEVLDPGLTILKGRMLKYINRPKLMLANMDLEVKICNLFIKIYSS